MSPMVSRSVRKESLMIPLWDLARPLRALELANPIDGTSQADWVPVTTTTEDLMAGRRP